MERNQAAENKLAMDVFAWFMNVSTSVLIVFVNKFLMDPTWGFKFVFATSLCAFHFLSCGFSVWAMEACGFGKKATLPWKDTLVFAVIASVSIASLNLSLLVNSVGFYQISKLLIIPFVCMVEFFWLKRRFTLSTSLSIVVVVIGVGVVTVTDVTVNPLGLIIAGTSVVTSGLQQIMCGTIQRKFNLTSNQLLANTAPVQGVMLLVVGPFVDQMITSQWILDYQLSHPVVGCLVASCAVAVLVNISQFMCLGRFSAVTFQVLGHTKTVLVLICGWLYLGDIITSRKLLGMVLAVVGMAAYGYFNSIATTKPQAPGKRDPALQPLLGSVSSGGVRDAEAGGDSSDKASVAIPRTNLSHHISSEKPGESKDTLAQQRAY